MKKKTEHKVRRGGRPRVRTGDEVQVTVEFPLQEYAQLAAFMDYRKSVAIKKGTSVANESKKMLMLALWQKHWNSLPRPVRRAIEANERYQDELARGD